MRTRGDQVKERSHCRPPYIPAKVSHTQEIDIVPKVFPCRPRPRAVPEMGDTF
ncbi:hypothetical protein AAZX31_17G164400 [Glycine max]